MNFYDALESKTAQNLGHEQNETLRRIVEEYGAIFVVNEKLATPPTCAMFDDETHVSQFQESLSVATHDFDDVKIELQRGAMNALLSARRDAQKVGLDITPRGGSEAARRSYADTLRLWDSRFAPALVHWQRLGEISEVIAQKLKSAPLLEQIGGVLTLESRGLFFSKDLSKSILYSVAAPGCSQHLSMLAFDVAEFYDANVREILAANGWFRTVQNDLPHFTFLGYDESELEKIGLRKLETNDGAFWIPNTEIRRISTTDEHR
ncbi:MAG: hypothetical protein H7Z37_03235 [Pyrinomonadaceae bacterium]|nr:hypothetical protein [Pyrinomonadaceae bacterium]